MTVFIAIGLIFLLICILGFFASLYFQFFMPDTTLTQTELKRDLDDKFSSLGFKATRTIPINESYTLAIDENSQSIVIYNLSTTHVDHIPFSSIVECEICQDNSTIMKDGIKRAVIGGIIAGTTGAIVGATTSPQTNIVKQLSIKIRTDDIKHPLHTIVLFQSAHSKEENFYKQKWQTAELLYSTIIAIIKKQEKNTIINENPTQNNAFASKDYIDQLRDLSNLYNEGILTSKEYESKKADILAKM